LQTRLVTDSASDESGRLRSARAAFVSSSVIDLPGPNPEYKKSFIVRDLDGHALEIVER
jgi:hypothetical protein